MQLFLLWHHNQVCLAVSTGVWAAVLIGSIGGIIVGLVTEYYTGGAPVKIKNKGGEIGSATIMITGFERNSTELYQFLLYALFLLPTILLIIWCWKNC